MSKGLSKPVKVNKEFEKFLGKSELPRTEIIQKMWDHIKANKLQTKTVGGKPSGEGKHIVVDSVLLPLVKNTNTVAKSGKATDLRNVKEGDTFDMLQMASVIGANLV